jgi:hypothetical protein
MKITQVGRTEHRLLSQEIGEAIKAIGTKYGVTFDVGGGTVGAMTGRIHVNVEIMPEAGGMTAAEKEFKAWCGRIGMKPEHWAQTFISNGRLFRISGLKIGSPKYDLLADEVGGRGRPSSSSPRRSCRSSRR